MIFPSSIQRRDSGHLYQTLMECRLVDQALVSFLLVPAFMSSVVSTHNRVCANIRKAPTHLCICALCLTDLCREAENLLADFHSYDPSTQVWENLTAIAGPLPREGFAFTSLQDDIYLFGGALPGKPCSLM